MSNAKEKFNAARKKYLSSKKGKTPEMQLKYLVDQVGFMFEFMTEAYDEFKTKIDSDTNETKEKEDLHELLREELKGMGLPEHYKAYEILDHFITGIEVGLIVFTKDDANHVPDEVYAYIAGEGRNAGYAKRAITMLCTKITLPEKSRFGFADPVMFISSNDILLCNMYKHIVGNM